MCLYPRLIRNRKYIANKKNGGNVPEMKDSRVALVPVGCGYCMECMKKKANEWKVRLLEEIKTDNTGKFVTLTFNNETYTRIAEQAKKANDKLEGYELDNAIASIAVREFLERWRKKYKESVKHWLITELGQTKTEHLHLHGIIWTEDEKAIDERWNAGKDGKVGFATIGNGVKSYVSEKTVTYITKYVTKVDVVHKYYKPKII